MDSTINFVKKYTKNILESAKTNLEKDKFLTSVVFFVSTQAVNLLPVNFKTEQDKNNLESVVKSIAKQVKANAVIFLSDGWSVTSKTGVMEIRPSKHPSRKECITISVVTRTHASWTLLQYYTRNGGKINFEPIAEEHKGSCRFIDETFIEHVSKKVH